MSPQGGYYETSEERTCRVRGNNCRVMKVVKNEPPEWNELFPSITSNFLYIAVRTTPGRSPADYRSHEIKKEDDCTHDLSLVAHITRGFGGAKPPIN